MAKDRIGAIDAREAAALGVDDVDPDDEALEDGLPSAEATDAAVEAEAEKMHDPQQQFETIYPEKLPLSLYLEREVEEERDIPNDATDPDAGTTRGKVKVVRMFKKPIFVRHDLKPKDIAVRRVWDHFDQLQRLMQVQLREVSVDVPDELTNDWFDAHPGYVEVALSHPNVRAKAREIIAMLAEAEEIREVSVKGKIEKRMMIVPVPMSEIAEGLEPYTLDLVILALDRRYKAELQARQLAMGRLEMESKPEGKDAAGALAAAPATNTAS